MRGDVSTMGTVIEPIQATSFALPSDFDECRRLHKHFGTTYFFASQRFPLEIRDKVHALYGFVRVPDEIVDAAGSENRSERMSDFRRQLIQGYEGVRPEYAVLRAFVDVATSSELPLEEPLIFLDAMEADISKHRYADYGELKHYMRGSAASVGLMMCYLFGISENPVAMKGAEALGEAMQLTNFLRDVGEDVGRGRIYLPLDELAMFRVPEQDVLDGRVTAEFVELMKFQIDRAHALYRQAEACIPLLPGYAQAPVMIALRLYERILDRIVRRNFDVFSGRARTSRLEKVSVALRVVVGHKVGKL